MTRQLTLATLAAAVFWPAAAQASDMAILIFLFTFPVCLLLVGVAFVMRAMLKISSVGWLTLPSGAMVLIQLYLLPEMVHGSELGAWGIQLAVCMLSLFAVRMPGRRAKREVAQGTEE